MKPVDPPAPAADGQPKLTVVQPLPPKRRWQTHSEAGQPIRRTPDIIFLPAPAHRPTRLPRSGQPFQVWKEPMSPTDPAPAKASKAAQSFREIARAYGKMLAFFFSWRGLNHTP